MHVDRNCLECHSGVVRMPWHGSGGAGVRSATSRVPDPTEWATKMRIAKERAAQIKASRQGSAGSDYDAPPPRTSSFSSRAEVPSHQDPASFEPAPVAGPYGYARPQPYGAPAPAEPSYGVPSNGSVRPGYRAMVSFNDPPEPAPSAYSSYGDYGSAPATSMPAARAVPVTGNRRYAGPVESERSGPVHDPYAPIPKAVPPPATEEEPFMSFLRSDSGPASRGPGGAKNKKPEWNSDYVTSDAPTSFAGADAAPLIPDDLPPTAARLARMRAELGARNANPQAAKQYAGLVEGTASRPGREARSAGPPVPAAQRGGRNDAAAVGGSTPKADAWDDMPVGGGSKAKAVIPEYAEGHSPVVAQLKTRSGPAPSSTWDEVPEYEPPQPAARRGAPGSGGSKWDPPEDAPWDGRRDEGKAAPTSKLALLKSKIRSGSARATGTSRISDVEDQYDSARGRARTTSYGLEPEKHLSEPDNGYGYGLYTNDAGPSPPQARRQPAPKYPAPQAAPGEMSEQPTEEVELIECDGCGRKFMEAALEKHQRVCAKVFQTKRKVFDSKAQAVPDEAKALQSKPTKKPGSQRTAPAATERPIHAEEPGKTKWAAKSSQLRDAMRAARDYNVAKAAGKSGADLPPPVSSAPDPSLVQCPNCGRSFNETAAERHIPKCSSIKARPTALRKGSGLAAGAAGVSIMNGKPPSGAPPRSGQSARHNEYQEEAYYDAPPARAEPQGLARYGAPPPAEQARSYARYSEYSEPPQKSATLRPSAGSNIYPSATSNYGYASDLLAQQPASKTMARPSMGGTGRDFSVRSSGGSMGSSAGSSMVSGRASVGGTTRAPISTGRSSGYGYNGTSYR